MAGAEVAAQALDGPSKHVFGSARDRRKLARKAKSNGDSLAKMVAELRDSGSDSQAAPRVGLDATSCGPELGQVDWEDLSNVEDAHKADYEERRSRIRNASDAGDFEKLMADVHIQDAQKRKLLKSAASTQPQPSSVLSERGRGDRVEVQSSAELEKAWGSLRCSGDTDGLFAVRYAAVLILPFAAFPLLTPSATAPVDSRSR